jgi:hypothetical protein
VLFKIIIINQQLSSIIYSKKLPLLIYEPPVIYSPINAHHSHRAHSSNKWACQMIILPVSSCLFGILTTIALIADNIPLNNDLSINKLINLVPIAQQVINNLSKKNHYNNHPSLDIIMNRQFTISIVFYGNTRINSNVVGWVPIIGQFDFPRCKKYTNTKGWIGCW